MRAGPPSLTSGGGESQADASSPQEPVDTVSDPDGTAAQDYDDSISQERLGSEPKCVESAKASNKRQRDSHDTTGS